VKVFGLPIKLTVVSLKDEFKIFNLVNKIDLLIVVKVLVIL